MMYYVKIYTVNGRNNVQKSIIAECQQWNGTLLTDEQARKAFIGRMCDFVLSANSDVHQSRRCNVIANEKRLSITANNIEYSFVEIDFFKVNLVYDGNIAKREKEGGAQ